MTAVWALIGLAVVIALVVAWRVTVHDRTVKGIRLGFFYERDRDRDDEKH